MAPTQRLAFVGVRGMRRSALQAWLRIGALFLLLVSLTLLSEATQNSARFGSLYVWLLLINVLGLLVLQGLIVGNVWQLLRQRRRGQVVSRLTVRLVLVLGAVAVIPVSVVYYFSMQFLRAGIDSWFDVRVEAALRDALRLSQASLDLRMRELLRRVQAAADAVAFVTAEEAVVDLGELREELEALELALLESSGNVIAARSEDSLSILPERPDEALLLQLRQGGTYVGLNPQETGGLSIQVLVPVPAVQGAAGNRILQAVFPISPRL